MESIILCHQELKRKIADKEAEIEALKGAMTEANEKVVFYQEKLFELLVN